MNFEERDAMIDSMVDDAVKQYGAKATNKIATTEANIQNDGKVSETGKTVIISSGEEVNVNKIESIDPEKNKKRGEEIILSKESDKVVTMVVPTNEELAIARETVRLVK